MVLRRIGHRQSGAVHQLDRAPAPQPWCQSLLAEQPACLARERTDHLQWQPLASPAIAAGANAARAQAIGGALGRAGVDGDGA